MNLDSVQVKWDSQRKILFKNLNGLRNKEVHTDITLLCDGQKYPAHRLILTMTSGYFAKVLDSRQMQLSPSLVLVCGIKGPVFEALLNFIYDGVATIKGEDIPYLVQAGVTFEIPGLMEMGSGFLSAKSSVDSPGDSSEIFTPQKSNTKPTFIERKDAAKEKIILQSDSLVNISPLADGKSHPRVLQESQSVGTTANGISDSSSDQSIALSNEASLSTTHLFSDHSHSEDEESFEGWETSPQFSTKLEQAALVHHIELLACCCFKGEHNYIKIAKHMENIINEYDIPPQKILSTVTDNGSNFVKAFKEFAVTAAIVSTDSEDGIQKTTKGSKRSHQCPICGRSFFKRDSLTSHVKNHKTASSTLFCKKCSKPFNTQRLYKNHLLTCYSSEKKNLTGKRKAEEPNPPSGKYSKKSVCDEMTIDSVLQDVSQSFSHDAKKPYLTTDDSIYDEEIKSKEETSASRKSRVPTASQNKVEKPTQDAIELEHSVASVLTKECILCHLEFTDNREFKKHRTRDCVLLECPYCLNNFKREERMEYREHVTTHRHTENPYTCPRCDFATNRMKHFEDHVSVHTGVYRFSCSSCDFQTSNSFDLEIHSGEKGHR